jgi:hypothetical protein
LLTSSGRARRISLADATRISFPGFYHPPPQNGSRLARLAVRPARATLSIPPLEPTALRPRSAVMGSFGKSRAAVTSPPPWRFTLASFGKFHEPAACPHNPHRFTLASFGKIHEPAMFPHNPHRFTLASFGSFRTRVLSPYNPHRFILASFGKIREPVTSLHNRHRFTLASFGEFCAEVASPRVPHRFPLASFGRLHERHFPIERFAPTILIRQVFFVQGQRRLDAEQRTTNN